MQCIDLYCIRTFFGRIDWCQIRNQIPLQEKALRNCLNRNFSDFFSTLFSLLEKAREVAIGYYNILKFRWHTEIILAKCDSRPYVNHRIVLFAISPPIYNLKLKNCSINNIARKITDKDNVITSQELLIATLRGTSD